MQPHTPYFGDYADTVRKHLLSEKIITTRGKAIMENKNTISVKREYSDLLNVAWKGSDIINDKQINKLYEENLKFVLRFISDLIDIFDGKSVITADHGEMLGQPEMILPIQKYRHPRQCYTPEVRLVPWLEVNTGSRREIISEPPQSESEPSDKLVEKQLKALGYKD